MKKYFFTITAYLFISFFVTSCDPDEEPAVFNKFSGAEIHDDEHGYRNVTIMCLDPVGPACAGAATTTLTQAQRSSFNTLKEYYYADDVPGFIQNTEWQVILPDLDPAIPEKLINREYTLKIWNPEEDMVTILVQKNAGEDYSKDNVAYAFRTYRE